MQNINSLYCVNLPAFLPQGTLISGYSVPFHTLFCKQKRRDAVNASRLNIHFHIRPQTMQTAVPAAAMANHTKAVVCQPALSDSSAMPYVETALPT